MEVNFVLKSAGARGIWHRSCSSSWLCARGRLYWEGGSWRCLHRFLFSRSEQVTSVASRGYCHKAIFEVAKKKMLFHVSMVMLYPHEAYSSWLEQVKQIEAAVCIKWM